MSKECLELGTIQAYVDGELSPVDFASVSAHTAACRDCTLLLAEAEEENSFVFAALDREMDTLVPTQRLWTRISESIEVENGRTPLWKKLYAFVTTQIASPTLAAAAGVLVIFGFAAVVFTLKSGFVPTDELANNVPEVRTVTEGTTEVVSAPNTASAAVPDSKGTTPQGATGSVHVIKSNHSPEELRRIVSANNRRSTENQPRPQYLNYQYLPGEESYIKTIAELEQNTSSQNSAVRASGQVAFQRDLAVVDEAIKRMRDVVRKNPRNQAARQVLYAAYQDKVDLLNSAAQRDELMASLR